MNSGPRQQSSRERRPATKSTVPLADVGYSHNGKSTARQTMITALAESLQPRQEPPLATRMLRGALAGLIATAPMSMVMILLHHYLPQRQRYALPPRQIHDRVAAKSEVIRHIEEPEATTLVSHFAYGATAGALYAGMVRQKPSASILAGIVFGLAVWAGSYQGWIPALQILPPATEQPLERNLLMVASHVVWGGVTGWLTGLLNK
jgi:uncharacterized membrane protein YagU involved in acid resistance